MKRGYHHGNLRQALVEAALALIAEKGPQGFTLSEAAKVQLTFKPTGKPKRKTFKLKKQSKAGKSVIKLKKGKLKAGKYRLSVTATDAAGNKSKSVVRKVKVGS